MFFKVYNWRTTDFFPLETNKISRKTSKILFKKNGPRFARFRTRHRGKHNIFFFALFIRYAPPTTALHVFGDSQCPTKYVTFIIHMSLLDLCQRSVVRLRWSPAPWWFTSELRLFGQWEVVRQPAYARVWFAFLMTASPMLQRTHFMCSKIVSGQKCVVNYQYYYE